ncbi:Endopolyphosphatase [Nowakowskiella sp. JEL0407]|nr:Endopolyphosphatase [Nowakowskiella sp. JEL0407]
MFLLLGVVLLGLLSPVHSGSFLHITDLHIDPFYRTDSPWIFACHHYDPVLARKPKDSHFLSKTFGSPTSGCDSPVILINETFRFVHSLSVDFILWTGDSARHDIDPKIKRSAEEVIQLNSLATHYFQHAFKNIPIVPNIGNNDLVLHNSLEYTGEPVQNLIDLANVWKDYIPKAQVKQFTRGGYFYVDISHQSHFITVISLNTMYFFKSNSAVSDCTEDSVAGSVMLKWMQKVLKRNTSLKYPVYIIGHVPPTLFNYYPKCYEKFSKVVEKYSAVIKGQMYGHMNIDHFVFPTSPTKQDSKYVKRWQDLKKSKRQLKRPVPKESYLIFEKQSDYYESSALEDDEEIDETVFDYEDYDISLSIQNDKEGYNNPSEDQIRLSETGHIESPKIVVTGITFLQLYWKYLMFHYESTMKRHKKKKSTASSWFAAKQKKVPMPAFVSPSVIPTYHSGVRVYEFSDGGNGKKKMETYGELTGYTQYYANLTYWNTLTHEQLTKILWDGKDPETFKYGIPNPSQKEYKKCIPIPHDNDLSKIAHLISNSSISNSRLQSIISQSTQSLHNKVKDTTLPLCRNRYLYEIEYIPKDIYSFKVSDEKDDEEKKKSLPVPLLDWLDFAKRLAKLGKAQYQLQPELVSKQKKQKKKLKEWLRLRKNYANHMVVKVKVPSFHKDDV